MSSAARLTELECPQCRGLTWVIDPDFLGRRDDDARLKRVYACAACRYVGTGWHVRRQSPHAFLQQPHALYPITREEFDRWVGILRTHFPEHHLLRAVGGGFAPYLPEQAEADRMAHARAHPVGEMRDQDRARRIDPQLTDVIDWIDMMKPGDTVTLHRRDGRSLRFAKRDSEYSAACVDANGDVRTETPRLDVQGLVELSRHYLKGDVDSCARLLRHENDSTP